MQTTCRGVGSEDFDQGLALSNTASTMRKIMVAVDESEDSRHAVEYVLQNVCQPSDRLLILNVHPWTQHIVHPGVGAAELAFPPEFWQQLMDSAKLESEALVRRYTAMAAQAKIPCEGFFMAGDPRDVIAPQAKAKNVDLLVLGSHGKGALKRAFLGSVSGHCLNHASCPVLIVRRRKEEGQLDQAAGKPAGRRTILIAVDGSPGAINAFRWAIHNVCSPKRDQVVIMKAQTIPPWAAYAEFSSAELEQDMDRRMLEENREFLARMATEASGLGLHCSADVVKGDAREAILWAVDRHQADLLVMGSRGLGAIPRLFLGSVSSYCCHHANCPVLVVKSEEQHQEKPAVSGKGEEKAE